MKYAPILALLLLTACEGASFDSYTDRGTACVYDQRPMNAFEPVRDSQNYPADTKLEVEVFMGCAAGGCTSVEAETCTVTRSGNEISITTQLETKTEGSVCTADCQLVNVSCEIDPLPAGTYTIRYGSSQSQIEIGATQDAVCLDGSST